jgi:hypothetical protein
MWIWSQYDDLVNLEWILNLSYRKENRRDPEGPYEVYAVIGGGAESEDDIILFTGDKGECQQVLLRLRILLESVSLAEG